METLITFTILSTLIAIALNVPNIINTLLDQQLVRSNSKRLKAFRDLKSYEHVKKFEDLI